MNKSVCRTGDNLRHNWCRSWRGWISQQTIWEQAHGNQQSSQNIDCFWSQLKIPNKLGNIRKRKDVINVNILQLIWNKISIPRNIDTILGRRLDCFTCFLWFSWLTVVEDDDDGVDSSLMDLFLLVAFWLIYSICNVKYIMKIVLVTISSSSRDKTCTS